MVRKQVGEYIIGRTLGEVRLLPTLCSVTVVVFLQGLECGLCIEK